MPQPQRAKEKEKHNQTCKLFLVFQNTDFKNRRYLRCLWALQSKHCYCFCLTCHAATANPIRNKDTNCKLLRFFWIFGLWILAFWRKFCWAGPRLVDIVDTLSFKTHCRSGPTMSKGYPRTMGKVFFKDV